MIDQKLLEKLAREAEDRAQQERVDKIVETQTKIVTVSYDKAAAYTNIIIVAGYATFFGLWSLTKGYVSKPLALWAALLMSISVVAFVLFEVYKMFWVGRAINEQVLTLGERIKDKSPDVALAEFQKLQAEMNRMVRQQIPIWRITLLIAVPTGFGAIGVLGYSFINSLFFGNP